MSSEACSENPQLGCPDGNSEGLEVFDALADVVSGEIDALRAPLLGADSRLPFERVEHPQSIQGDVVREEQEPGAVEPRGRPPRPALIENEQVTKLPEFQKELQERGIEIGYAGVARASRKPYDRRPGPFRDGRKAHESELDRAGGPRAAVFRDLEAPEFRL